MISSIDLFCGAGGLTLGLKRNGIDCKIAVEIEKDFAETFKLNNKNASSRNIWTSGISASGINNFTTSNRDILKPLMFY